MKMEKYYYYGKPRTPSSSGVDYKFRRFDYATDSGDFVLTDLTDSSLGVTAPMDKCRTSKPGNTVAIHSFIQLTINQQ